jgi:hypothetical protein
MIIIHEVVDSPILLVHLYLDKSSPSPASFFGREGNVSDLRLLLSLRPIQLDLSLDFAVRRALQIA